MVYEESLDIKLMSPGEKCDQITTGWNALTRGAQALGPAWLGGSSSTLCFWCWPQGTSLSLVLTAVCRRQCDGVDMYARVTLSCLVVGWP